MIEGDSWESLGIYDDFLTIYGGSMMIYKNRWVIMMIFINLQWLKMIPKSTEIYDNL